MFRSVTTECGVISHKVPDLRGRTIIGNGEGERLSLRVLGTSLGDESVTMIHSQMPIHRHPIEPAGHHRQKLCFEHGVHGKGELAPGNGLHISLDSLISQSAMI